MSKSVQLNFLGIFLPLTLLFFSQESRAQGRIQVQVIDSLRQEILPFATWELQSKAFKTQGIGDENGKISMDYPSPGSYQLIVRANAYRSKTLNLELKTGLVALKYCTLAPKQTTLENVQVNGIRPNVILEAGKQIFRADVLASAKGGTAVDVLRNIPGLSINAEGEITWRGSKGFMISINGKPSQVDASTLLSQLAANGIEQVELIQAPSAQYEADGKAGIINIITKQAQSQGWAFQSNALLGLPRLREYVNLHEPQRHGMDWLANYKNQALEFNLSLNYLRNDIAGRRIGDVWTQRAGIETRFPSLGERSFRRENYGLRSSLSYRMGAKDQLSAGLYLGERAQYRRADIFYDNTRLSLSNGSIRSKTAYFNPNLVLKSGSFRVGNLDYSHRFSEKSTISASGLYEYALIDGWTKNQNLSKINYSDTLQATYNTGSNPLHALRLKLDYERSGNWGKWAIGYQYRNQIQQGVFVYEEKSGNGGSWVLNPFFSAKVQVINRIHGLYTQWNGKKKAWEYALGLRFEPSKREFSSNRQLGTQVLTLNNWFPSGLISYQMKDNLRLKLSYNRRVQRSSNNELNPYPEREHSETLEQGDPNILPEFIGNWELGINQELNKGTWYLNVYRQDIQNLVNRVNKVFNDSILNRVYTNAGNARLLGLDAGFNWGPHPKFKVFLGGNLYQLRIQGSLFQQSIRVNTSGWIYGLVSNLQYQIHPQWSAQFNMNYASAKITAQGRDSRLYQPNFALKKSFKRKPLSLLLQWQQAGLGRMKVNEQSIQTAGADFYTYTNYIQERNIIQLNLSYVFKSMEKKAILPQSEFGEKEF